MSKQKQKKRSKQKQKQKKKRRSLHRKHKKRRKKDLIMKMPFIIGFQGDPAAPFWCNDYKDTWELVPRYYWHPKYNPFARLQRYLKHHITSIAQYKGKVLIYKAPELLFLLR